MAQSLRDVGLPVGDQMPGAETRDARRRRRTGIALLFALGILALSVLLTLTGVVAALWHMAWWVGIAFLAMSLVSLGMVIVALVILQPPATPEERERQRRYWEDLMRQGRAPPSPSDQNPEQGSGA
jgi:uncharacterized membrane protein YcjF (UPF0283 family)